MNRSKSPDRTNEHRDELGGVGRDAAKQILALRAGEVDLTRTPVILESKPVGARSERAILCTCACTCRRGPRPGSRVITHRVQLILGRQEPIRQSTTVVCTHRIGCTGQHRGGIRTTGPNSVARGHGMCLVTAPLNTGRLVGTPRVRGHLIGQTARD